MMECPIWGTPANLEPPTGDSRIYDSPRAGGKYRIAGTAESLLGNLSVNHKKVLTTWLCQQRRAGIPIPNIEPDLLDEIKTRRPMRFSERVTAALTHFDSIGLKLGDGVTIKPRSPDEKAHMFVAATESEDTHDLFRLLQVMKESGHVEAHTFQDGGIFSPTFSGWQEIDRLAGQLSTGTQGFVAMWFDASTDEAYEHGFYKAIYNAGYDPLRIDQKQHLNKIDDEIIAEIRRSRFLVADFTCESGKVRGGVYFEAGFAMALPIPVIWTCKDTSIHDLHFDTRQYAHIVWKDSADLYKQLRARIAATIGDGPRRRT